MDSTTFKGPLMLMFSTVSWILDVGVPASWCCTTIRSLLNSIQFLLYSFLQTTHTFSFLVKAVVKGSIMDNSMGSSVFVASRGYTVYYKGLHNNSGCGLWLRGQTTDGWGVSTQKATEISLFLPGWEPNGQEANVPAGRVREFSFFPCKIPFRERGLS